MRVGSYQNDQTTDGGLFDNDDEVDSYLFTKVPIDDNDLYGLRVALWRLTESRFRETLTDWSNKEAARLTTVDPHRKLASYTKLKPLRDISYPSPEEVRENAWVLFCKKASKWLSELSGVTANWVEFNSSQETKIFVSTEKRILVQNQEIFTLSATIRHLTKEGLHIERDLVLNCVSQRELPSLAQFKKLLLKKHGELRSLMKAKKLHSYSGPVLLKQIPSGLLFHEAIGHRLEGSRLLHSGEGQTFKGQIGKTILGVPLSIRDNPLLTQFEGQKLVGSYKYDDEGTPASDALLLSKGKLQGFLNTRAALPARGNTINGHARNRRFQRPISRMGVTIVEGEDTLTEAELREELIAEIKRQKKPFGLIVYETAGGETDTSTYDFQAFSGEIAFATRVFPDGKEEVIRGVDFVGTPLQALSNITAVGGELEAENHFCGAESGFIPVTTISPSVLVKNLELQAKDEELLTQYILPKPKRSR